MIYSAKQLLTVPLYQIVHASNFTGIFSYAVLLCYYTKKNNNNNNNNNIIIIIIIQSHNDRTTDIHDKQG